MSSMARSAFSTAAFAQLVRRLRHTNARYNQIALQFRCRVRHTHHAKRRAHRVGLRIDLSRARKSTFTYPPPVLDRDTDEDTTENESAIGSDAYMRGMALRGLPEVVVRKQRRLDGRTRQRIVLRLPPLKLPHPCDPPTIPGAPKLMPKQLPEDEYSMDQMMPGSVSSHTDVLAQNRACSGLCITIPPRSLKRKLQDVEADATELLKRSSKVR